MRSTKKAGYDTHVRRYGALKGRTLCDIYSSYFNTVVTIDSTRRLVFVGVPRPLRTPYRVGGASINTEDCLVTLVYPLPHALGRLPLPACWAHAPRSFLCVCVCFCQVCRQSFMSVSNDAMLTTHVTNKHGGKKTAAECFPGRLS